MTGRPIDLSIPYPISIHTSPKGGDSKMMQLNYYLTYFNPHLPEGR